MSMRWATPPSEKVDKDGQLVEQRQYNTKDFDRTLILTKRTELVARRVWEYLQATDSMAKTIVLCDDQPHAERIRQASAPARADLDAHRP